MVNGGIACYSSTLCFCYIYFFFYSFVQNSFIYFAIVAGKCYSSFIAALTFTPFPLYSLFISPSSQLCGIFSFVWTSLIMSHSMFLVSWSASMNISFGNWSGPKLFFLFSFFIAASISVLSSSTCFSMFFLSIFPLLLHLFVSCFFLSICILWYYFFVFPSAWSLLLGLLGFFLLPVRILDSSFFLLLHLYWWLLWWGFCFFLFLFFSPLLFDCCLYMCTVLHFPPCPFLSLGVHIFLMLFPFVLVDLFLLLSGTCMGGGLGDVMIILSPHVTLFCFLLVFIAWLSFLAWLLLPGCYFLCSFITASSLWTRSSSLSPLLFLFLSGWFEGAGHSSSL